MDLPGLDSRLECNNIPNTQKAVDELGMKWYRKGLNSVGNKIFLSWATQGCYGRAFAPVNESYLVITKEHIAEEHLKAVEKKSKKGKSDVHF